MPEDIRLPLTRQGFDRIAVELKRLKEVDRPAIIKAIGEARALGDLSENAEYHAARERQGWIEALIRKHEDTLARAEVIDPAKLAGSKVRFSATVTLQDEERGTEHRYQIVGEEEADNEQGRLSLRSPLGRALIGHEEGDDVEVRAPGGVRHYTIVQVEYV